MKPRVKAERWKNLRTGVHGHEWIVTFKDGCGCVERVGFGSWQRALSFALNIARGVDRWHA